MPKSPLDAEIARFDRWTRSTRQNPADWDLCYPFWSEAYRAVEQTLAEGLLGPATTDDLLVLLTRDHGHEQVLERLASVPMSGYQVAARGISHPDASTRRQVALLLGRLETMGSIELLRELTRDEDPGVRASAIAAIRPLDPLWASDACPPSQPPEHEP